MIIASRHRGLIEQKEDDRGFVAERQTEEGGDSHKRARTGINARRAGAKCGETIADN